MWCRTIESACFISLCGRVCLYLVEAGAERRVDLRGAGEPQSECDLARRDEVIEMGETGWERAGARRQASPVAGVTLSPGPAWRQLADPAPTRS